LLVNVNVPLAEPLDVGVKVTVNETLEPAPTFTGKLMPLTLNSELSELTPVTCTAEPLADKLADFDALAPTVTLPKLKLVGFAASCPGVVPVPDKPIPSEGLLAFEVNVSVPLALPPEDGANCTVKVTLCPADKVVGSESPLTSNAPALELAPEIVTSLPPELVTVSDFDVLFPT
jgi:hypothetical protein